MSIHLHPLTGAPLTQPDPPPLRTLALHHRELPCTVHDRGPVRDDSTTVLCIECGTTWDGQGQPETLTQRTGRLDRERRAAHANAA